MYIYKTWVHANMQPTTKRRLRRSKYFLKKFMFVLFL